MTMINDHIKRTLQDIVGIENVVTDNASLLAYSYVATARHQSLPDDMVAPRNTEDVASIVHLCNTEQIPIVPRGSGTHLFAGTTPSDGGIVLTFKHMTQILEIDEENLPMTVETGVYTK